MRADVRAHDRSPFLAKPGLAKHFDCTKVSSQFFIDFQVFTEKCLLLILFLEIEKYIGACQLIYHQLQPVQLPDHVSIAIGSHGFLNFLSNCKTEYFPSQHNEN